MPRITVGRENGAPIEIHYEDRGSGDPVVMVHGYPLDGNSLGAPGARAARQRLPRDHLRPPGVRSLQPAHRGLRLTHLRGRPRRPARASRPERPRPRRALDGIGRADAPPRDLRLQPGAQGRAARRNPPFLLRPNDNSEGVNKEVLECIKAAIVADPLRVLQGLSSTTSPTSTGCDARAHQRAALAPYPTPPRARSEIPRPSPGVAEAPGSVADAFGDEAREEPLAIYEVPGDLRLVLTLADETVGKALQNERAQVAGRSNRARNPGEQIQLTSWTLNRPRDT